MLWSLVTGGLLVQLNKEGLYTQGYTDDLALLITRKFPNTVSDVMEKALNIAQRRCRAHELSVNPNKMELMFIEPTLLNTFAAFCQAGEVPVSRGCPRCEAALEENVKQRISKACCSFWLCYRTLGESGVRSRRSLHFSLYVPARVFQAEIFGILSYTRDCIERNYTREQSYIYLDSQEALQTLET
jgi:hypothetical protein